MKCKKPSALFSALALVGALGAASVLGAASANSASPVAAATVQASSGSAKTSVAATSKSQDGDVLAAIVRDLKITKTQAKKRIKLEEKARQLEPRLQKKLGKKFAGLWISKNGKKIVVGVTTKKAAKVVKKAGATPKIVKSNLTTLKKRATKISKNAPSDIKNVNSWWVDPATNKVVIEARSKKAAKAAATAAGLTAGTYEITVSDDVIVPVRDYWGGDALSGCTLAFPVYGGFLTAGHCAVEGKGHILKTEMTGGQIGTVEASQFGDGIDAAWAKNYGDWNGRGRVTHWNGGGGVDIKGSNEAAVGAHMCKSGRTTKWTCGYLLRKDVSVNYGNGHIVTLNETSACALGGDSGGAYVWNDQAQGITSGSNMDTNNCRSFYQPVNTVLNKWKLSLVTSTDVTTSYVQGYQNNCIDVPNSDFTDGKQLQVWNCNGTNAQKVSFHPDGTLRINGKCLDARWAWTHNGTEVQLMNCNGHIAQKFTLNGAGDLVNVHANKCVDVKDWGGQGGKLQLWECSGGANQKWWRR
ncbi:hypothetical protein GCM10010401_06080 [Rarobacter faecitabidus]|uniref:Serine protease 1 n=2 Tax=Rarobacter faecitabidus TaxID=13243 RepID=SP1_RARFA|nr:S1 family peptidase [Rarobacter faecitabidus]Q05308.1 RecName: Full=Serine protease 1; AltName: Full=Serine protease I; Short=RPI; Flags: Precursor [Rarobacter faecitabidus]TQL63640.1 streptogrisin C [Rarobacter faecitabidus]BAA01585.1 prepro RPI [Rarobacter faecitabidus]